MREFSRTKMSEGHLRESIGGSAYSVEESIEKNGQHTLRADTSRYVIGVVLFPLLALYMINKAMEEGDFATGLFGGLLILGAVYCLIYMLPNYSYLTLSPDGFTVRTPFQLKSYKWTDIEEFGTEPDPRTDFPGDKRVYFTFTEFYRQKLRTQPPSQKFSVQIMSRTGSLPNNYQMKAKELADLMNRLRNYFAARSK